MIVSLKSRDKLKVASKIASSYLLFAITRSEPKGVLVVGARVNVLFYTY